MKKAKKRELHVHVGQETYAKIIQRSYEKDMTVSSYIRDMILKNDPDRLGELKDIKKSLDELMLEVLKIKGKL